MKRVREKGSSFISATEMASVLEVHHTQIRKDLDSVGVTGMPKKGHPLEVSIRAIESFLGWNDQRSAFLVGVGNLGRALLGYRHFELAGIKVLAAFDNDGRKCGTNINGVEVFPVSKFVDLVKRMHVNIVILTTPVTALEEVKRLIGESGVKAVWNFMPLTLDLPGDVIVENANLFSSLAVLSHKLKTKLESETDVALRIE
jgi:redox-sensing transcriptional repressor